MVEQVLLNLARNGMQAMPEGDPPLGSGLRTLRLHAEPAQPGADRAWVRFAVTDHGHGLDPDVQAQLFTPFVSTKPEGMGLGLSLCRTVVEQHGGHLQHAPASPRGTVFQFTLPAA
jgi:two-component system sensor histidine kinase DctS